mgnify:CR=1 FL=1
MAGFKLVKNLNDVSYETVRVASQAYTIGDAVMRDRTSDTVDVVPATSSSTTVNIYGVAMETVASSATSLLIARIEPSQVWEVQSDADPATNSTGLRMLLTDANTVNYETTDNTSKEAVCEMVGFAGAATERRLLVRFLQAAIAA